MIYPVLFIPGTGWKYGVGLDWAGQIVTQDRDAKLTNRSNDFLE
jgi:hypothetical protein